MDDRDLRGVPVFDASGEIGRVVEATGAQDAGPPGDLWVQLSGQDQPILISPAQIREATPDRVTLALSRDQLLDGRQTIRVPLHQEVLHATTHAVERGKVRIHKTVETVPYEQQVPVGREDVSVERVPVGQIVEQAPAPRWEGDTLIIPLVDEVLVVAKRLRVREELRITRTRAEEPQTVRADLQREVAQVETSGETSLDPID